MVNLNLRRSRRHPTQRGATDSMRGHTRRFAPMGLLSSTVLLSALLIAPASEAKIYKWVDTNGVTQYTQYPPSREFSVEVIKPKTTAASVAAKAKEILQKRIAALDERRNEKKLAKKEGDEAATQREKLDVYCTSVKNRLADYRSDRNLAEQRDDGSYVPVTDEMRAEEIGKMQAQISERCS